MGNMSTSDAGAIQPKADFDLTPFYQIFFDEARENLANFEALMLAIDVDAAPTEDLNAIFRVAHSIKGGASTFGFRDVTELTHELETVLDLCRRNELKLTTELVDCLLKSGDALTEQLARHQRGGDGAAIATAHLLASLRQLSTQRNAKTPAHAKPDGLIAAHQTIAAPGTRILNVQIGPLPNPADADSLVSLFSEIPGLGLIVATDGGAPDRDNIRNYRVETTSADGELLDLFTFYIDRERIVLVDQTPAAKSVNVEINLKQDEQLSIGSSATAEIPSPARAEKAAGAESATLRVSVEKVDQLINLVGELVITQAMLAQKAQFFDPAKDQNILVGLSDLERNTRDLQQAVMSIRMIPMSFVFNRFPRMLRDLAAKLDKQVELKTTGDATELDKGLIEKITDPLTHLLRNAIDHGIETPAERVAAGKPAKGTIHLSAQHQGASIVIEVSDDGRGLNREKLLVKARSSGLAVRDDMTDKEVWQLIFEPGFSTAETVTDVSGRGVGMDVVKRSITSLGGTVELSTAPGGGTKVSVRLPLTLAIMDGMSVGVGSEIYILPLAAVIETFQLDEARIKTLENNHRVVEVRGQYLAVKPLDELFGVPRVAGASHTSIIVIIESEGKRAALIVDELIGQHQVVVKNLETNYQKVEGVSGATILGDGKVALILDVHQFIKT